MEKKEGGGLTSKRAIRRFPRIPKEICYITGIWIGLCCRAPCRSRRYQVTSCFAVRLLQTEIDLMIAFLIWYIM